MAVTRWKSTLYPSELFVEACGALVFDLSSKPKKVMLLYDRDCDEWLLSKGRRNCHESRQAAALREIEEESGYVCRLRPLAMATRAPAETEPADVRDAARTYEGLTEPFMLDVRDQGVVKGVTTASPRYTTTTSTKLVWWFIAEVEDWIGPGEPRFKPHFFDCDTAMERLTYQKDRDVLCQGVELLQHQCLLRSQARAHKKESRITKV